MILVLRRRTQSLNEASYEHSLTHMLVPVVWVDAVVYEGAGLSHVDLLNIIGQPGAIASNLGPVLGKSN